MSRCGHLELWWRGVSVGMGPSLPRWSKLFLCVNNRNHDSSWTELIEWMLPHPAGFEIDLTRAMREWRNNRYKCRKVGIQWTVLSTSYSTKKLGTFTYLCTAQGEESAVSVWGLRLWTSGKRMLAVASVCTHCPHSHLKQRKALSIPSLTHMGKALLSHGAETFSPWHDCAHVNSMHSCRTSWALYTPTQGFLHSPQNAFLPLDGLWIVHN